MTLYPESLKFRGTFRKFLVFSGLADSDADMIRGGFLSAEDRKTLIALAAMGRGSRA
jgi:hypothetical protein